MSAICLHCCYSLTPRYPVVARCAKNSASMLPILARHDCRLFTPRRGKPEPVRSRRKSR